VTPEIAGRVEQLRGDTVSGAVQLAVTAIDIALAAPDQWRELAREYQAMHPAIAAVANVGRLLASETSPAELARIRASLLEGNRRIAEHLASFLPAGARVITISQSSTVEAALLACSPARVYALESLPGGEGRALAARTGAAVIPDAAMGRAVPSVDCALVGIDAFDRPGAILHKVGTLPLALCCAYFRKPFYAAGHSFKLAPVDAGELLARAGEAGSKFDHTPPDLITAIVTEQGRWR
jgi:translation initiation factor 2B subunit (eIF-2B alpha/beta/delta family)